jgi:5-methylthioadenosine/S-adenosylhomocysteine deaminase
VKGWLADCVVPFSPSPISEADAHTGVQLSTLDLISTGVTTVVDWSHAYSPDFVRGNVRALNESGLRFVFAYLGRTAPSVIDDIRRVKRESIDPNPRATLQLAAHPSPFFFKNLQAMVDLSRELGVMLNVHLLENINDRADDPIRLLQEADALGPNLLVNHAVHLTDDEIATLAAHQVRVAHNPLSNMRLASGIMRLPEMHAAGLRVGLGLDGGTNDTSDMFNNMRAAVGLQRAKSLDANVFPTVSDVLRMATIGGAEALGMDHEIGSLTPGKKADLIILDPETLNFAPRFDWASQIVFNAQPRNVEWVFVDGHPLMRKGKLVGSHPEQTIEDAEDAVARIRAILQL